MCERSSSRTFRFPRSARSAFASPIASQTSRRQLSTMIPLLLAALLQGAAVASAATDSVLPPDSTSGATIVVGRGADSLVRSIAIDERLAADAGLRVGDLVELAPAPGEAGERVRISAIIRRSADPS